MPDLSRAELAAYAACAVLVAVLGWRALRADGGIGAAGPEAAVAAPPGATDTSAASGGGDASSSVTVGTAGGGTATVHVVGEVRRPGVYRFRIGQRVQDAIRRAGGPGSHADLEAINLAAKLTDAQQVVVPRKAAATGSAAAGAAGADAGGPGGSAGGAAGAAGGGASTGAAPPINLNSATPEQLDTLPGVGPATVQKILDYRAQHGGFASVDDLTDIPGIGPKRLDALRELVVV